MSNSELTTSASALEGGAVVLFNELPAANAMRIGQVILNIPTTLNSLTSECIELLLSQLSLWAVDNTIACVFIEGAGEKAFCAGGDVQALRASSLATPGGPCVEAETFFAREYRMNHMLHCYNKPVIVWGDGIVMGGGLGIFAGASHRVVTETSRFAMPEVTIGLYPDVGGSYFLNQITDATGRFLALTGASFNAADAVYIGIANYFVARSRRAEVIQALTEQSCNSDQAVSTILANFADQSNDCLPSGNIESHQAVINSLLGYESSELGIAEVLAKFLNIQTDDKWLAKAKHNIAHGSPLSVLLIDQQLKRCKDLPLAECFRRELILSTNIVRYPEFAEGVRALLIDKDQNPQWQFTSIEAISDDLLNSFFAPPWDVHPLADLS